MKICSKCHSKLVWKPGTKIVAGYWCHECCVAYHRQHRQKHREYLRLQQLARRRMRGAQPRTLVIKDDMKRCWKCSLYLSFDKFPKDKNQRDGHARVCKPCACLLRRQQHILHREREAATQRRYWKHNPQRRLHNYMNRRIRTALQRQCGLKKTAHTYELVGCTPQQLKAHIEAQFEPMMSWKNMGFNGWHLHHIKPCEAFDLTIPSQQQLCFHYTNLRPMWAEDHWHAKEHLGLGRQIRTNTVRSECLRGKYGQQ